MVLAVGQVNLDADEHSYIHRAPWRKGIELRGHLALHRARGGPGELDDPDGFLVEFALDEVTQ